MIRNTPRQPLGSASHFLLPHVVATSARLFADECFVYHHISSPSDLTLLQDDLRATEWWCSTRLMTLNLSKCEHVCFSYPNSNNHFLNTCHLNNNALQSVSCHDYPGAHVTSDLSWDNHIDHILSSANHSFAFLKQNFNNVTSSLRRLTCMSHCAPNA